MVSYNLLNLIRPLKVGIFQKRCVTQVVVEVSRKFTNSFNYYPIKALNGIIILWSVNARAIQNNSSYSSIESKVEDIPSLRRTLQTFID